MCVYIYIYFYYIYIYIYIYIYFPPYTSHRVSLNNTGIYLFTLQFNVQNSASKSEPRRSSFAIERADRI